MKKGALLISFSFVLAMSAYAHTGSPKRFVLAGDENETDPIFELSEPGRAVSFEICADATKPSDVRKLKIFVDESMPNGKLTTSIDRGDCIVVKAKKSIKLAKELNGGDDDIIGGSFQKLD